MLDISSLKRWFINLYFVTMILYNNLQIVHNVVKRKNTSSLKKPSTSTSVSKDNTNTILTNTFYNLYSEAKVQYTCTMKCCSTIKKSDIMNFEGKWVRLEKKTHIM